MLRMCSVEWSHAHARTHSQRREASAYASASVVLESECVTRMRDGSIDRSVDQSGGRRRSMDDRARVTSRSFGLERRLRAASASASECVDSGRPRPLPLSRGALSLSCRRKSWAEYAAQAAGVGRSERLCACRYTCDSPKPIRIAGSDTLFDTALCKCVSCSPAGLTLLTWFQ